MPRVMFWACFGRVETFYTATLIFVASADAYLISGSGGTPGRLNWISGSGRNSRTLIRRTLSIQSTHLPRMSSRGLPRTPSRGLDALRRRARAPGEHQRRVQARARHAAVPGVLLRREEGARTSAGIFVPFVPSEVDSGLVRFTVTEVVVMSGVVWLVRCILSGPAVPGWS